MRKNDLKEIKTLSIKEIEGRVLKVKEDLAGLELDKNMKKLTDLKVPAKKRNDLAQMLTILRQKELLGELESRVESPDSSEEIKGQKAKVKSANKQSLRDKSLKKSKVEDQKEKGAAA